MYTMYVPKFLWSEVVMTITYLINPTPSRVIRMKAPSEMLLGKNKFFFAKGFLDALALLGTIDPTWKS
jgi:hypothetical protein